MKIRKMEEDSTTTRDDHENEIDRLSDLPEALIHHIMSFLPPADALRFGTLSNTLYSARSTFPALVFDSALFSDTTSSTGFDAAAFFDFFRSSLERRRRTSGLSVHSLSFHLSMKYLVDGPRYLRRSGFRVAAEAVANLASFAIEKKTSRLSVSCDDNIFRVVNREPDLVTVIRRFPSSVFSSQTIKALELKGLVLESKGLILDCPLIEEFFLAHCIGLESVEIANCSKLRSVEILRCCGLERFDIRNEHARLESFSIESRCCHAMVERLISQGSADSLKCLKISCADDIQSGDIVITSGWFRDKVSKFASLETLVLEHCLITGDLRVRNEKLERLELLYCLMSQGDTVDISAPGLRYLRCSVMRMGSTKVNFGGGCGRLKSLHLCYAEITESWAENNLVPLRSSLEDLTLECCSYFEASSQEQTMELRFEKLKRFELYNKPSEYPRVRPKIAVQTPSLDFFFYRGTIEMAPLLFGRSVANDAKLCIWESHIDGQRKMLRDFLSHFAHCNSLILSLEHPKELVCLKEERQSLVQPLHGLKNLEVRLRKKPESIEDFVDSLLWLAPHPETITIINKFQTSLRIKFSYGKQGSEIKEEEDNTSCCSMSPVRCWRHDLSKVEIEDATYSKSHRIRLMGYFMITKCKS